MREIKFRALAIVNHKRNNINVGDFVYGSYIESKVDAPCIIWGYGEQIEIDRKTLGQFTGASTTKGIDIYGGDIVKGEFYAPEERYNAVGTVNWCENKLAYIVKDNYDESDYLCEWVGCEVVGNIHQNPELLTKQDNNNE